MRAAALTCGAHGDRALDDGDGEPQHRAGGDQQHRGRVDGADRPDDECTEGGVAPAGSCRRPDRQADDPPEGGPWQEHRGRPRHVRDEVRRELIEQTGGDRRLDRQPEPARRPGDSGAGRQHDRPDPQAVGHPVRQAEGLGDDVPRSARPGVGDHLVGHPPGELTGIERPDRVADETPRVEVEVQLGVGRHPPRRRQECRQVGEHRHHDDTKHSASEHDGTAGGCSHQPGSVRLSRFRAVSSRDDAALRWGDPVGRSALVRLATYQS